MATVELVNGRDMNRQAKAVMDLRHKLRSEIKALRGSYRSAANPRSRVNIAAWSLSGDQHADAYTRRYTRELARDLERNAGAFVTLAKARVNCLVGAGVRPRPTSTSEEWNQRASDYIHAKYTQVAGGLDIREKTNFYGIQKLFAGSVCRDGDMGMLKTFEGGRLAVQCFESEQIEFGPLTSSISPTGPQGGPPGTVGIIGGIALDGFGRALGFYGCPYSRGYNNLGGVALGDAELYSADEFLFSGISSRYSQTRGIPELVSILDDFERTDSYVESEIIAAEQSSQIYGVMQYPLGQNPNQGRVAPGDEDPNGTGIDGGRNSDGTIDWQPTSAGSLIIAPNGMTYIPVDPKRPNRDAEPFFIAMIRQYCAVVGLPYEIAFNDFRGLSWSNSRSLVANARDIIASDQMHLLGNIFSEIYLWVIANAIEDGELPPIDDWAAHEHEWPVMGWPDPLKEVQTNAAEYAFGSTSLSRVVGRSWQKVLKEQNEEQRYRDALTIDRICAADALCKKANAGSPEMKLTWREVVTLPDAGKAPGAFLEALNKDSTGGAPSPDNANPGHPAPAKTPKPEEANAG